MELIPELITLLQSNIPAILTIIVGVIATRFILWKKFKSILANIANLLNDVNEALLDDAITVDEVEILIGDILNLLKDFE